MGAKTKVGKEKAAKKMVATKKKKYGKNLHKG